MNLVGDILDNLINEFIFSFSINYYPFSQNRGIYVSKYFCCVRRGYIAWRGGSIKRQHHNRKTITLADPDYQSNWHIRAKRVNDALV